VNGVVAVLLWQTRAIAAQSARALIIQSAGAKPATVSALVVTFTLTWFKVPLINQAVAAIGGGA